MMYDKLYIAAKLRRWEKYLNNFQLPVWDDLPDLGLYMDQVILLLTQYLDYLPPDIKEDHCITASTINNYVRMKVMPQPVRKKYYRVHIAYLVMICTLKQALSIANIQKLVPMDISEEEVCAIYSAYVERHRAAALHFIAQVRLGAAPILDLNNYEGDATAQISDLIASSAISAGFARLMAEKLLLLEGRTAETDLKTVGDPPESAGGISEAAEIEA